jgi:hypothetical protein
MPCPRPGRVIGAGEREAWWRANHGASVPAWPPPPLRLAGCPPTTPGWSASAASEASDVAASGLASSVAASGFALPAGAIVKTQPDSGHAPVQNAGPSGPQCSRPCRCGVTRPETSEKRPHSPPPCPSSPTAQSKRCELSFCCRNTLCCLFVRLGPMRLHSVETAGLMACVSTALEGPPG